MRVVTTPGSPSGKPLTVGQKAAWARKTGSYTIEPGRQGPGPSHRSVGADSGRADPAPFTLLD